MSARSAILLFAAAFGILSAVPLIAQPSYDTVEVSNPMESRYVLYFLGAFIVIFFLLVITIISRKLRGARKADFNFGMSMEDVGDLKRKGLLTDEESRAVRQALARQFTKQFDQKPKLTPDMLLADPDVLKLREQAEQKRQAALGLAERLEQIPKPAAQSPIAPMPLPADPFATPQAEAGPGVSAATSEAPKTEEAKAEEEEDVALPPDIVTMAELGLITPEELENIKARTRAKRRELRQ